MIKLLNNLQTGLVEPHQVNDLYFNKKDPCLKLSKLKEFERSFSSAINDIDLDPAEGRYLLSGCVNGSLLIHDLLNFSGTPKYTCKTVTAITREHNRNAHRYCVECVQWYPIDTGFFTSSGMDQRLKIWDANRIKVVENYKFPGRIYQHSMSSVPSKNCLISVASSTTKIFIVDLKSGSRTHELRGHSDSVLACTWSPTEEHLLATGGCDNRILLWDVRSSKSFLKSLAHRKIVYYRAQSKDQTIAHNSFVNGLNFTSNGHFLLSIGMDGYMKLWDLFGDIKKVMNYGETMQDVKKRIKFGISFTLSDILVYIPCEDNILVYSVNKNEKISTLKGHFGFVNCCIFNRLNHELLSGGNDSNVVVWSSDEPESSVFEAPNKIKTEHIGNSNQTLASQRVSLYEDAWSDDEFG